MSGLDLDQLAAAHAMPRNHEIRMKAAAELQRFRALCFQWASSLDDMRHSVDELEAERDALQATLNACAIYLKDGETPAQRIHRDHCDALALMSLLAQEKRKSEALLEALKHAEAALADIGDADREPGDDLAWCEARAAEALPRIRAAITKTEGT